MKWNMTLQLELLDVQPQTNKVGRYFLEAPTPEPPERMEASPRDD